MQREAGATGTRQRGTYFENGGACNSWARMASTHVSRSSLSRAPSTYVLAFGKDGVGFTMKVKSLGSEPSCAERVGVYVC